MILLPPAGLERLAHLSVGNSSSWLSLIWLCVVFNGAGYAEFAATLQSKLSESLDKENIDLLLADTGHHVQLIHNAAPSGSAGPLPPKLAKDVERHGRDLWNLCVRLKRERNRSAPMDKARLLLKARSLAFSMLELGRSAGRAKEDTGAEVAYLMSLSLTLGKHCVEDSDLESARLALQKTAELMERIKAAPLDASDPREQSERTKLDAEYLAMRTALVSTRPWSSLTNLNVLTSWRVMERR